MNKILILPIIALTGCQATATLQGVGEAIPGAVGQLDDTVYAIAIAKYKAAQRFQAEVEGTMPTLPKLPEPKPQPMPPTPVPMQPIPSPSPNPHPPIVPPQPVTPK